MILDDTLGIFDDLFDEFGALLKSGLWRIRSRNYEPNSYYLLMCCCGCCGECFSRFFWNGYQGVLKPFFGYVLHHVRIVLSMADFLSVGLFLRKVVLQDHHHHHHHHHHSKLIHHSLKIYATSIDAPLRPDGPKAFYYDPIINPLPASPGIFVGPLSSEKKNTWSFRVNIGDHTTQVYIYIYFFFFLFSWFNLSFLFQFLCCLLMISWISSSNKSLKGIARCRTVRKISLQRMTRRLKTSSCRRSVAWRQESSPTVTFEQVYGCFQK